MMPASGMDWPGMLLGPHVMIALFAVWLILMVAMIRSLNNTREPLGLHLRTSREILDEHLAKGEIDRNEYVERSKTFDLNTATL